MVVHLGLFFLLFFLLQFLSIFFHAHQTPSKVGYGLRWSWVGSHWRKKETERKERERQRERDASEKERNYKREKQM